EVFWIDFQGTPRSYGKLPPNQSLKQSTFAGHSWAATIDGSKPIWCATASAQGQKLEILSMNVESDSLFPNRNGRRRANRNRVDKASDPANTTKYKIERDHHQIRFLSDSGQVLLDTAGLDQAKGSESSRYDQPIYYSTD
ncbi:MAG: hypothetical protein ACKO9Q_25530, partial [Pirellula sp.]